MAEKKLNPKTGEWEYPIGSKERAAEVTAAVTGKKPLTPMEKAIAAQKAGYESQQRTQKKVAETIGGISQFWEGVKNIGAEDPDVFGGVKVQPQIAQPQISKPTAVAAPATAVKALPIVAPAPAITPTTGIDSFDQTSPVIAGIDTFTPAINMPAPVAKTPTWKDKISGIGADLGKWAEDPKIARALMAAGLQTLATEPRRVPYSNAEMLARAGIAGIGAYDTEVAKEAAGREMARKAGIEERGVGLQERQVKLAEDKQKADVALTEWQKIHPEATLSNELVTWKGKTGYLIMDKQGKPMEVIPASQYTIDYLSGKGKGGSGGGIGSDMEDAAQKAAQVARVDHLKEFPNDIEGANVAASSAYDDYIERPTTRTIPGTPEETGGWFFKGTPAGPTTKESRGVSPLRSKTLKEIDAEIAKLKSGVR